MANGGWRGADNVVVVGARPAGGGGGGAGGGGGSRVYAVERVI